MSSHREAPEISKDPVADNTDTYAFVSPDRPDTVTLVANYLPLEDPAGGPNFFEFGDDVLYTINIDNDADGDPEIAYQFAFTTRVVNPESFLYNTGPITVNGHGYSDTFNRQQSYTVTKVTERRQRPDHNEVIGRGLASPPCNIGPRSTPDYAALADAAIHDLGNGVRVFAGQRRDPFYVDLGSVFDLADLRPFQELHLIPTPNGTGVNALSNFSVHSIVLQVPISHLTRDGSVPTNPMDAKSVIGVWATASRRKARVRDDEGDVNTGPWTQVSRLANPLFNEVIVPMGHKDRWNALPPSQDSQFLKYVQQPEVAKLLPILYPTAFPHLANLTADRADLVAVLLTGIPAGLVPGFQNYTGPRYADQLRLNVAIPPTSNPNPLGLAGRDLAGFPNGRRLQDDVVTVELRALAGLTYPIVDPSYIPDAAAGLIQDGTTPDADAYLPSFPYLGLPRSGYDVAALTTIAGTP